MAAHLMRSLAVSILHPALHLSPCPAASRGLGTSLLRPFRSGLRSLLKPGLGVLAPLPTSLTPALQPALGFKTKGVIKKRCKDCYLVKRRGRWYIYCKTNPRHKQRQM